MIIYDNEYQQGASRGTVNAMAADTTQNWTLTFLNGDVSYARSVMPSLLMSPQSAIPNEVDMLTAQFCQVG